MKHEKEESILGLMLKDAFLLIISMSELLKWYISIWGIIKSSSYLSLYLKKFYIVLQLDF